MVHNTDFERLLRGTAADYVLWVAAAVLVLLKLPLACLEWVGWDYAWGALAVGCLIVGVLRNDACFSLKWGGGLLLFLIVAAVGVAVNTPDPVFRCWMRWGYLSLVVLLLAPVLRSGMLDCLRRRMWVVVCWALLAGVALSGVIYVALAFAGELPYTFKGVYNHPMTAAFMAALAFCVCMGVFMAGSGRISWRGWVALAGTVVSLLLICAGGSRMALLSAMAAMAFYVALYRNRRVAIVGGALAAFVALIFVIPGASDEVFKILLRKFSSGVEHESFTWSRDALWQARWEEFLSSPWVGIGIGNQTVFAEPWDDIDAIMATGNIEPGSSWLAVLSQTGAIGFIAFAAYNVQVIVAWFKSFTHGCSFNYVKIYNSSNISEVPSFQSYIMPSGICIALMALSLTEGYVLAGGSFFCIAFWLVMGLVGTNVRYPKLLYTYC